MVNVVEKVAKKKDKLFNFRPAFFTALFLIFGILFGYYKIIYGVSSWWLLALAPVVILPLLFSEDKRSLFIRSITMALLIATFFLGFCCMRYQLYDYTRCGYYNGEYTVTGTVVSRVEREGYFQLVLKDVSIDGNEEKGLLNAYLPASYADKLRIADIVVARGTLQTNTTYSKEYFRPNAINDGKRYSMKEITECQYAGRSKDVFLRIRDRVEEVVYAGMDETAASVTLGVLMGDTTKIESNLLDNMRKSGVAHIFAVSGLHVGALYGFITLLFTKTRLRKISVVLQFCILAAVLLFYAGVCGFSPSIVRAITLCLVGYCMRRIAGSSDTLNTLGVAAIIILLFAPCSLFEIGFQLSFTACLGIVLFAKRIGYVCDEGYKLYRKILPRRYTEEEQAILAKGDTLPLTIGERYYSAFASLLSASLAAQILTAPLQYMAFGYLSGWSFILNLIFVPLIGAVFAVLLLCVFLACLLPLWCSGYLLYIPAMLINLALLLFEVVDFSSFVLTGIQLSSGSCISYYGGVVFLTDKLNVTKRQRSLLSAACFTACIIILALLNL